MTKLFFITFSLFLSFTSFSLSQASEYEERPTLCLSHGECQDLDSTVQGSRCLLVKTGVDNYGSVTCAVRCYSASRGMFCRPLISSVFGFCEREVFPTVFFDPTYPDCSSAIDPLE